MINYKENYNKWLEDNFFDEETREGWFKMNVAKWYYAERWCYMHHLKPLH